MANIKSKDIKDLSQWNKKELRKLRMTVNNRIRSLSSTNNPKSLPANHPLFEFELPQCRELLEKVISAESKL